MGRRGGTARGRISAVLVLGTCSLVLPAFAGQVIYSNLPATLPVDNSSLSYDAWVTAELGNLINLDNWAPGTTVGKATVAVSNFAPYSAFQSYPADGYAADLTLTFYNVGNANTVGSVIGSSTTHAVIQWQPESEACSDLGQSPSGFVGYLDSHENCTWGLQQLVDFSFDGLAVPSQLIYSLAFTTGDGGPIDALNYLLNPDDPSVGGNPLGADIAYWNTALTSDNGGTDGVFALNEGWTGTGQGTLQLEAGPSTPEPATLALAGLGLAGLALTARKKARRS